MFSGRGIGYVSVIDILSEQWRCFAQVPTEDSTRGTVTG